MPVPDQVGDKLAGIQCFAKNWVPGDERMKQRFLLLGGFLAALLQRGAENIAERRAGVGRAVLGDRLLLLGDLQRLDRNADLARLLVELRHAGIDLLADRETL